MYDCETLTPALNLWGQRTNGESGEHSSLSKPLHSQIQDFCCQMGQRLVIYFLLIKLVVLFLQEIERREKMGGAMYFFFLFPSPGQRRSKTSVSGVQYCFSFVYGGIRRKWLTIKIFISFFMLFRSRVGFQLCKATHPC